MPVTDAVARDGLAVLAARPGVVRVGLALVEGGGRRLSFTASDRDGPVVDWCHIDAYDDVPLNTVVRTGVAVVGSWDALAARYPAFVERQRGGPAAGLVAQPLAVHGQVLGAVIAYVADPDAVMPPVDGLAHSLRTAQSREPRPDGPLADQEVADGVLVADHDVAEEPAAVGRARRFLRGRLHEWGLADDAVDAAVLCLSELVTNAVVHTGAPSEVRAVLEDDVLTVIVRDRGSPRGSRPPSDGDDGDDGDVADPLRVHGRGLGLVASLASRWGSELDEVGTTVWFVLDQQR
ncbi:MAG: ATP-binding region ATPase domain protein [Nocardioides sp.]|nr:ATP-binding region ATPase domain protein [Nocardioides sp.]